MNIGADRMAAILAKKAKEQQELNIWRQFGGFLPLNGCFSSIYIFHYKIYFLLLLTPF